MSGILRAAAYLPYRRLNGADINSFFGTGGGRTSRTVASHDEDTTTMGVEAARLALSPGLPIDQIKFVTPTPAYADKNNASTIHAALRMDAKIGAWDVGGSLRSTLGALLTSFQEQSTTLLISADLRDGLPTSADEASTGDGAAAIVIGSGDANNPELATFLGSASRTDEFVDRWRAPGEQRSRVWEERFGETRYVALGPAVFDDALANAGLSVDSVTRLIVTGLHARAVKAVGTKIAKGSNVISDSLTPSTGQIGGAHPLIALSEALETAAPGDVIVILHLADGADAIVVRATDAVAQWRPAVSVADQIASGAPLPYAKFLSWRSMVTIEPPRRPEPARVSSSAAWRAEDWKFGFVGSRDTTDNTVHLPPTSVSKNTDSLEAMEPIAMADALGTVVTFTIDRMVYSPSPPVVFAIVDFDGGGRFPIELTDVDAEQVAIGDRVGMTFRRLFTADGIHDYFWKARPLRGTQTKEG